MYESLTAVLPLLLFRTKKRPPFPFLSLNSLPPCHCFSLCPSLFLQNYKVVKRTARTKALWKVFLLEVKRHHWCPCILTVLMLWFVFFPLR